MLITPLHPLLQLSEEIFAEYGERNGENFLGIHIGKNLGFFFSNYSTCNKKTASFTYGNKEQLYVNQKQKVDFL